MVDSAALRTRRSRRHRAGDHSLCRNCDRSTPTGLGWPSDDALTRATASWERFATRRPAVYVPRSQLSPGELAVARARDREKWAGACSRCGKRMAVGKRSLPPDRQMCQECRATRRLERICEEQVCQLCERSFERRLKQRFCSKQCANAWNGGHRPPYVPPADPNSAEHQRTRALAKSRARQLRHAQTWDGISDGEILDRDGWRCGICRRRIGKGYKYPHPRSRSVDHIVPLSLGGDDTAVNKRAAHLGCNIRRGNEMGAEQLGLFGVIREPPLATLTVGERTTLLQRKRRLCACGAKPSGGKSRCKSCWDKQQADAVLLREERAQGWGKTCRIYLFECRYCRRWNVARRAAREVCTSRACQLARLMANNLRVRNGLTAEEADAQMAAVVTSCLASRLWQSDVA